jgi:hypothetical protein
MIAPGEDKPSRRVNAESGKNTSGGNHPALVMAGRLHLNQRRQMKPRTGNPGFLGCARRAAGTSFL